MKIISILGSTGSIGESTLKIVRLHPKLFRIVALAARSNIQRLEAQAREFCPQVVAVYDSQAALILQKKLKPLGIQVVTGDEGLQVVSTLKSVDQVICAMVGSVGLTPIFAAVRAGKSVAVANKEPLVMAGKLLLEEARKHGGVVLPVDSEHSAVWQCLEGRPVATIAKLTLTSSGGPFRSVKGSLSQIQPKQALKHPKWKMGPKITIDSATLMNKGLEVIEAANLFGFSCDRVEVLIHPEAIVHGMIEFVDGSYLAHMGVTDMRLPIQYAMTWPKRLENHLPTLNLAEIRTLTFEKPSFSRFPCLALGYEASRMGGTMPAVLNAANEVLVGKFLDQKIKFLDIPKGIEKTMAHHRLIKNPDLNQILAADCWAREFVGGLSLARQRRRLTPKVSC